MHIWNHIKNTRKGGSTLIVLNEKKVVFLCLKVLLIEMIFYKQNIRHKIALSVWG
jgi:hypothetical protein